MKEKLNADKTLEVLIGVIKESLSELYGSLPLNANINFIQGEKTAYVECLEIVQCWEKAEAFGVSGKLELEYPI